MAVEWELNGSRIAIEYMQQNGMTNLCTTSNIHHSVLKEMYHNLYGLSVKI